MLANPRENALYLLNFNRDVWDVDDVTPEDAMCLGACIRWTLMKDEREVKEEDLQFFQICTVPDPGEDLEKFPYNP